MDQLDEEFNNQMARKQRTHEASFLRQVYKSPLNQVIRLFGDMFDPSKSIGSNIGSTSTPEMKTLTDSSGSS